MSADGGHFGPRSGSLNTILAVDHLRIIDDMFGKRFTSLVQDHPMIIPAKSHFYWLSGF